MVFLPSRHQSPIALALKTTQDISQTLEFELQYDLTQPTSTHMLRDE